MKPETLKRKIRESLRAQGFEVRNGAIVPPDLTDKDALRALHSLSVAHRVERARDGLERYEPRLVKRLATVEEARAAEWGPRLVEVTRGSLEERLFRWAALHWSIPVSSGYGRRLRFLVLDSNDKLIGVIGLSDPVFALRGRDAWIGWDHEARRERLAHVMDAFVLGAVPPYSFLLGGKLVAMLATVDEVRGTFRKRYTGRTTKIREERFDGRLALVTTTSAFGRSSIYNRLRYDDRMLFRSAGYTLGYGEFHFSDGLYSAITEFAKENCEPSEKHDAWGDGFRSRREIVQKSLKTLGLSQEGLRQHGVRREIFVAPLAKNVPAFLRGENQNLLWHKQTVDDLWAEFKERWLVSRVAKRQLPTWSPEDWRLWRDDGR